MKGPSRARPRIAGDCVPRRGRPPPWTSAAAWHGDRSVACAMARSSESRVESPSRDWKIPSLRILQAHTTA